MIIIFASDLHGRLAFYNELEQLVTTRRPDVLILGGDLLPRSTTAESTLSVQKQFILDFLNPWIAKVAKTGIRILTIPGNDDLAASIITLDEKNSTRLDVRSGEVVVSRTFRRRPSRPRTSKSGIALATKSGIWPGNPLSPKAGKLNL